MSVLFQNEAEADEHNDFRKTTKGYNYKVTTKSKYSISL